MPQKRPLLALALSGLLAALAPGHAASDTQNPATGCLEILVAEYCFPGGDLSALTPINAMMAQGQTRAQQITSTRTTPSQIPDARREQLDAMWRDAIATAFIYADQHSMRVDWPKEMDTRSPLMLPTHQDGPILRFNFAPGPGKAFAHDGTVWIHKTRLLETIAGLSSPDQPELSSIAMFLSLMLGTVPTKDGYFDLRAITGHPALAPMLRPYKQAFAANNVSLMGVLGSEMVLYLYVVIEEQMRMRSIALPHQVHLYRDGSDGPRSMDTPQVTWSGQLLLSDEAHAAFSDTELELLMAHEAMHLMRPNFFMILSAADMTQRSFFPTLNIERSATYFNNLLGRPSPGQVGNCPLELSEDDELVTDYYVFYLYKDEPAKQRAYHQLLKRIHTQFNPGTYSQAAFRVRQADILIEHFENQPATPISSATQDAALWEAMQATLITNFPAYLKGKPMRLEDILTEMEKRPELALDSKLMRNMIEYYKRRALLTEGAEAFNTAAMLTCAQIETMFNTD